MIKINFSFQTVYGMFSDAIHLQDDHKLTDIDIEELKQSRLDNWLALISDSSRIAIDVPNVPTPASAISILLNAAEIKNNDVFYELGCGIADVSIAASTLYGCQCVGIEASDFRVKKAQDNVISKNLADKIVILHDDLFTCELSTATVIYLYLLPDANKKLEQKLFSLPLGTKIISYVYDFPNHLPDKIIDINDSVGYIWVVG